MIAETIKKYIPKGSRTAPNSWTSFNCPVCQHMGHRPDTRKRGGIAFTNSGYAYHCFNCKFKTRWEPGSYFSSKNVDFFHYMNVPESEINACRIFSFDTNQQITVEEKKETKIYPLPKGARKINELIEEDYGNPHFMNVLEYIATRNVDLLNWHDFYWVDSPDYGLRKRFIIPTLVNNNVVGWVARDTTPNSKQKYLVQVNKQFVFNSDLLYTDRKYCLIVEGQLDAISLSCTAVMSNNFTDGQLEYYQSSPQLKVVYPDKDKSGRDLVEAALDQGWYVAYPEWPEKDAAAAVTQYGRLAAVTHVLNCIYKSPLQIQLTAKKYFEG